MQREVGMDVGAYARAGLRLSEGPGARSRAPSYASRPRRKRNDAP
jgi:hypothetical protein